MNSVIKYLILGFLSLSSINCLAIDYTDLPAYEIEVVIFKFSDSRSAGNEVWPDLVTTESLENSIELHNSTSLTLTPGLDTKGYYYSKIPEDKFRLTEEAEKLVASGKYKILYHSAWIQPGLDKENAESIHIKATKNIADLSVIDSLSPVTITDTEIDNSPSLVNVSHEKPEDNIILEGLIKVELGRYLHINFDLKYQRDLASGQSVINTSSLNTYKEIKFYPVKMHRRMRSKEVHYIDHPLIGILVLATRFELPKDEDSPEFVDAPLIKLQDVPVKH